MEFRNIVIANPAKLNIKLDQLCITQNKNEVLISIDDISTLMVESQQVQLSATVLQRLAVDGVTVFFCDQRHLPSAQILPISQYSRKKKLLYAQFETAKPLQKRLWQTIVKQKITNQALCLRLSGNVGCGYLMELASRVRSGDPDNVEATAAAYYFKHLFAENFTRDGDYIQNAELNYGYAIIRGAVARNLVMHGLEPAIGLHHCNDLNQYNLADDLMEPFRPIVDLMVATTKPESYDELTPSMKRKLFNLTNLLVSQNGKRYRVMSAINRSAASLASSIVETENKLELPTLIELEEGRFE